jgi:hypothetical protein
VSRVGRAAARAVIRLYPRSWRGRYEEELLSLLDDSRAGIGAVGDLAAGALKQHMKGGAPVRFEPAHRHPSAFAVAAILVMAPTLALVTLSLIGHELGVSAVASAIDPLIVAVTAPRIIDLGLVLAPLAAFALAALPLLDARVEHGDDGRVVALRVRALPANLVVVAVAVLLGVALVWHVVAESVFRIGA